MFSMIALNVTFDMRLISRLVFVAAVVYVCYIYFVHSPKRVSDVIPAHFTLASYYSDDMVLQQKPYSSIIWGFCSKHGTITAQLDETDNIYIGELEDYPSENVSLWRVSLAPQPPGGPHNITITYTSNHHDTKKLMLSRVLFGDVWFCSGQSNMKRSLQRLQFFDSEKPKAKKYENIRFFQTIEQPNSRRPNVDLVGKTREWVRLNEGEEGKHFSALCWFFGQRLYDELKYPIGLVHSSVSGTTVEQWSPYEDLQKCNAENMKDKKEGRFKNYLLRLRESDRSSLWNAMIFPFLRMVIHGVIWYQGENNAGFHRHKYNCTFPRFINRLRKEWNQATKGHTNKMFPFGFVQLAGYGADIDMFWPWLRWHQTADYGFAPNEKLNNTFMAVAIDLPGQKNPKTDLHPRDKVTIADRLSWAALNRVYGKTRFPANSPRVIENTITYENPGTVLLNYDQPIILMEKTGFKYCCTKPSEDCSMDSNAKEWFDVVKMNQSNATSIQLRTQCKPSLISYAWKGLPCYYKQCPVYSNDRYQLPAAPWRWRLQL